MRLIVIGGGAAGIFCAVNAARLNPSLQVVLLEKTNKLLTKLTVSGGGRCNVTHACFSIPEMAVKYPRGQNFLKKTLHQFFTTDTIDWFKARGVLLKTEPDGRMFPVTDDSLTIVNCLMREAVKYKVEIRQRTEVKEIRRTEKKFLITTSQDEEEPCDLVCIACGGYPRSALFKWITATGHSIEDPVPSLFTFNIPDHPITALMGISVPAKVKIRGEKLEETGPVLITHWGLSGPAVLRLSARGARILATMAYEFGVVVNWIPDFHEPALRAEMEQKRNQAGSQQVGSRNPFGLPHRLWEFLCTVAEIPDQVRWAELTAVSMNKLIRTLNAYEIPVRGKTTFKEEFVTAGGVKLSEIDPQSMESRLVEGLYFAGEIMDVDGITGGFNFQHAWTSAWIAATHIAGIKPPKNAG